jgi:hypothetical protein
MNNPDIPAQSARYCSMFDFADAEWRRRRGLAEDADTPEYEYQDRLERECDQ